MNPPNVKKQLASAFAVIPNLACGAGDSGKTVQHHWRPANAVRQSPLGAETG